MSSAHSQTFYDVREDEEQGVKEEEALQLLVSAGYFRARIRGLSTFDKIVGGLCWCVRGCNVDIDIDLLFQENSTIGQKIGLTEKIVRALRKMKCPHAIEPHQIQGNDFIHIFPVVQWLVKQVIGRRDDMTSQWRQFATAQFNKVYTIKEDVEFEAVLHESGKQIYKLRTRFGPRRMLRKPTAYKSAADCTQIQTTLLEYGWGSMGARLADDAKEKDSGDQKFMKEMSQSKQQDKLAASLVGSLVGLQSDTIQRVLTDYSEKQSELMQQRESLKYMSNEQHEKMVSNLHDQVEAAGSRLEQLSEQEKEVMERYSELQAVEQAIADFKQFYDAEMVKLAELETPENKKTLAHLDELINRIDTLKKQDTEFKADCKVQSQQLQAEIEDLQKRLASGESSQDMNSERALKLKEQMGLQQEKLSFAREKLAQVSRRCAGLRRKLDDFPSQEETSQYTRRLMELAEQASVIHMETKKFFALYNTATKLKELQEREIQLLSSIEENFRTPSARNELSSHVEKIVESATSNRSQAEKRRDTEAARRDALSSELLRFREAERRYHKLVSDFQAEASKSERLAETLDSLQAN